MATTLLALAGAVLTVVLYAVLTDRLDYATIHRRQLDVWAVLAGFACLTTIVYGGAEVQRDARARAVARAESPPRPEAVHRQVPVSLRVETTTEATPSAEAVTLVARAQAPEPGRAEAPVAEAPVAKVPYWVGGSAGASSAGADAVAVPPSILREDVPTARGVYTPSLGSQALAPVTATARQVVIVATEPPPPPRDPTPIPPTERPPTEIPAPLPTATPHCGDPADIEVSVLVLEATADRSIEPMTVRYRAQATNDSTFPVTLVDILVTVESEDIGSEQFGHDARQDVAVEPGVVYALDGTVDLKKSPSPFGRTQLCVSFVTETCGRSVPYQVTKRCQTTRGF